MSLSSASLVTLVQAKNYLRVNAVASLHVDAEYVGMGDGSNKTFTLDSTPVEGSLKLYVDNVLQVEDTDFTISTATITFTTAPPNSDSVTASYDYAAGANTFEAYDDDLLEILIDAVTKRAEEYVGRVFIQREVTETHIGDNRQILKLYRGPVTDVSSITIGGTALTSWTERLTIGRLYHTIVWPLDYEVVIVYTAGYGANRAATQVLIPDAVTAVLLVVADLYENRGDRIDDLSIAGIGRASYKLPSRAEQLLDVLRPGVKGLG